MEEAVGRHQQVAVARALVEPTLTAIPVCVLNVSDEPVTLYAGTVVVSLQPVEQPVVVGNVSNAGAPSVDDEKRQMLQQFVDECGAELGPGERDVFYHLLLKYADVLASSTADLGRTNKLRHRIDTGRSPPVRQPVRHIAPCRREEVKELLNQMLQRGVIEPSCSP